MIRLMRRSGTPLELEASQVLRIRKTDPRLDDGLGNTLINAGQTFFVQEEAAAVAAAVKAELPSLYRFTHRIGAPVWVNVHAAKGPMPLAPNHRVPGLGSALDIGGKRQYVRESPEEVRSAIAAAGGDVQPIPDEGLWVQGRETLREILGSLEAWDEELTTPE
ncbi:MULTISPECIES: hypothetical protein [Ensifer]|jgi:hypothetical protein|uniref:Uncharacterized protein n=1 Tax=Ensifer canadensis TaxID=555315 RepID=A0AAW4FIW6_9HYPH|nr:MULTISPECIES: hypothetical protein [Ensifer]MDP9633728.1 hypothetical protein [Ensifer adhaerens]MBD9488611.1 hypothetical protein [Ensifer sp. ENS11]MBM3092033.1 hypothetical protein [Ensifer canadensis]NOV16097.1 hypothetical protein [Ensifer canadensis]UBI77300.1 hypothetical protein J3R84_09450 [Ensifer canadensis]